MGGSAYEYSIPHDFHELEAIELEKGIATLLAGFNPIRGNHEEWNTHMLTPPMELSIP